MRIDDCGMRIADLKKELNIDDKRLFQSAIRNPHSAIELIRIPQSEIIIQKFYSAVGDGEHDAGLRAFERDRMMCRARRVKDILARAMLARPVSIAAL